MNPGHFALCWAVDPSSDRRSPQPSVAGAMVVTYFGSNAGDEIHALPAFIRSCTGTSPFERGTTALW